MNQIINQIIALNIEIEGLMRVASERTAPHAVDAARTKLNELNRLFEQLGAEPVAEPQPEIVAFEAPAEEEVAVEAEVEAAPEEEVVEEAPEIIETVAEYSEPEPEVVPEPTPEPEPAPEPAPQPVTAPKTQPVALGDIRKAMTLNDKFYFRRELFGNSDGDFNDTLDLLTSMESFEEAEEYMYHDMQWDRENSVVADFMAVIEAHFRKS